MIIRADQPMIDLYMITSGGKGYGQLFYPALSVSSLTNSPSLITLP